jgi:hypothetical protein
MGAGLCLLGSQDLDKAAGKDVKLVGPLNVVVERSRKELGEDMDRRDVRVDAIVDRKVDQRIFAPNEYRRLGLRSGQWVEADSPPAAEHNSQYILACHGLARFLSGRTIFT